MGIESAGGDLSGFPKTSQFTADIETNRSLKDAPIIGTNYDNGEIK